MESAVASDVVSYLDCIQEVAFLLLLNLYLGLLRLSSPSEAREATASIPLQIRVMSKFPVSIDLALPRYHRLV